MTIAGNQGQNVYPNPDNYPTSSFPDKVPAPEFEPDDAGTLITVQYSWTWREVLMAAIDQLINPATWQGDHAEILRAVDRAIILKDLIQTETYPDMPAPYWDDEDADDADDQEPVDMQPWYGQIVILDDELTFVENAFIWVVTGFIAYAGQVGAAISFLPIARRFVIEAKKHPLGGIIRFFIDANEIGQMDTYSATDGVASMDIVLPDPAMGFRAFDAPPVLWLEMAEEFNPAVDGEPNIQIIRKRLDESEVYPTTIRYDPETGQVQRTYDGGATWLDYPDGDPRTSTVFQRPPRAGSNKACDAAANMVKWLRDFIDSMVSLLQLGAFLLAIVNRILEFFDLLAEFAILINILTELAETIITAGDVALLAAFTDDEYDALLCIFFCHCDPNGRISASQLTDVQFQIGEQLNTTAALITNAILSAQGEVGLSNAGAIGSETGECDDCDICDWCFEWDFAANQGGWSPVGAQATFWTPTVGWQGGTFSAGANGNLSIGITFPTTTITHAEFTYNKPSGAGSNNSSRLFVKATPGGTNLASNTTLQDGTGQVKQVNGSWNAQQVTFDLDTGTTVATTTCYHALLRGTGVCPFGTPNCG